MGNSTASAAAEAATAVLEAYIGIAPQVLAYLRRNTDLIAAEGPSLGAMESENQHLYKSRRASVPSATGRPSRVGSGCEPSRASVASSSGEVRYAAAVDSGMAGIG